MGSGGGGSSTTSAPPAYMQTGANELLDRGRILTNTNNDALWRNNGAGIKALNPFPDQPFAAMNQNQLTGLDMAQQRAMAGSPVMNAAQTNLQDTLEGKYLDPGSNPAWAPMSQAITDAYSRGTAAQTDAAAARANALGSSGYNEQVGVNQQALGSSLASAAGDLYNGERGRQMQANLFAPQAAAADYTDAQALLGVGDTQRQAVQDQLNNQYTNQYARQYFPYQQLQFMGSALSGANVGGGTTTQMAGSPSKTAGALGGAATGAAMGSVVPGWGTAIGAVAGGLYGALA